VYTLLVGVDTAAHRERGQCWQNESELDVKQSNETASLLVVVGGLVLVVGGIGARVIVWGLFLRFVVIGAGSWDRVRVECIRGIVVYILVCGGVSWSRTQRNFVLVGVQIAGVVVFMSSLSAEFIPSTGADDHGDQPTEENDEPGHQYHR